jgi:hypothetical protein
MTHVASPTPCPQDEAAGHGDDTRNYPILGIVSADVCHNGEQTGLSRNLSIPYRAMLPASAWRTTHVQADGLRMEPNVNPCRCGLCDLHGRAACIPTLHVRVARRIGNQTGLLVGLT